MAKYLKITSETTTDLVKKGGTNVGSIASILVANYSTTNHVTVSLFLEDSSANVLTNASNNKYYYINSLVLPVSTSVVFNDNTFFDSRLYNLRITTTGTSPLVSVMIR